MHPVSQYSVSARIATLPAVSKSGDRKCSLLLKSQSSLSPYTSASISQLPYGSIVSAAVEAGHDLRLVHLGQPGHVGNHHSQHLMEGLSMTSDRKIRMSARHLALRVAKHPKGYVLHKVYGDKRRISGVFHSLAAVERGLDRWLDKPQKLLALISEDDLKGGLS
jgi:hypothetical protein